MSHDNPYLGAGSNSHWLVLDFGDKLSFVTPLLIILQERRDGLISYDVY